MGKMFELLKQGLEEAIEYHRGNVNLRTEMIFIPDAPKIYKPKDIKKLRDKLNFSQKNFAAWLNVSLNTVQAWEQGTRTPNHSALRLLEIFDKGFSSIEEICKEDNKIGESKIKKKAIHTTSTERNNKESIAAKAKY